MRDAVVVVVLAMGRAAYQMRLLLVSTAQTPRAPRRLHRKRRRLRARRVSLSMDELFWSGLLAHVSQSVAWSGQRVRWIHQ